MEDVHHDNRSKNSTQARDAAELYLTARARHITAEQVATDAATRSSLIAVTGEGEPDDSTWRSVVAALADAEQIDRARSVGDLLGSGA